MSNGAECCALLICCPPAARREKLAPQIATFTGLDESASGAFLDKVESAGLTFAPKSFAPIASCGLEMDQKFSDWMAHEDLVFAPKAFEHVIHDLHRVFKKHC